ncbi:MAG TPA: thiol:disulfide interchange protein DsbA/DsbL [Pseudoxanthomonas sp.]
MKSRFLLLLLALLPLFAQAAEPVAGADYVEIPGGQPYAPLKGKVEVVELFGYTCIHCAHFQPLINEWKKKQPAYVRFTPVPAAFGGYWMPYARAYYAAAKLGVLAGSHDAMFKALHEEGSLPIQNASTDEIAAYYAGKYGVDARAFATAMDSPAIDVLLERSKEFATATGIEGTPTIIVNGKYRVTASSFEDALRTTDWLVARERAARK